MGTAKQGVREPEENPKPLLPTSETHFHLYVKKRHSSSKCNASPSKDGPHLLAALWGIIRRKCFDAPVADRCQRSDSFDHVRTSLSCHSSRAFGLKSQSPALPLPYFPFTASSTTVVLRSERSSSFPPTALGTRRVFLPSCGSRVRSRSCHWGAVPP